jgi:hypothetical protein
MNNPKKLLLTRTAPLEDFIRIYNWTKNQFQDSEIILLVQNNMMEKIKESNLPCRLYALPDKMLVYNKLNPDLIRNLAEEKPDYFIIASNNPSFSGYQEFLKIAFKIRAKNIWIVTKEGSRKIIPFWASIPWRWAELSKTLKKHRNLLIDIPLFILTLLLFVLIFPYLWFKHRNRIFLNKLS